MNETAELFQIRDLTRAAVESAKGCRNRLGCMNSLVCADAHEVATALSRLGVEIQNIAVRLRQSSMHAAADARREIRQ